MDEGKLANSATFRLVAYVVLACGMAWSGGLLELVLGQPGISEATGTSVQLLRFLLLPTMFAPALAALIVEALTQGREGLSRYGRNLFGTRFHLGWMGIAALTPVLIHGLALALDLARGLPAPVPLAFRQRTFPMLALQAFLLAGVAEECGWRGYLLPELRRRHGSGTASLVVGLIWALWSLPRFFLPALSLRGLSLSHYLLLTVALSVVYTWIWDNTHSVLPAILLHTMHYLASIYLASASDRWSSVIVYGLIALVIVRVYGIDRFARGRWGSWREASGGSSAIL